MFRRPQRSTRTYTLFPDTTPFRSFLPYTCLSFQWLLAKHAMRVFGRRRERLSGVCDFRRVAPRGIPKHPPCLAADPGKGFAREGILRGKTCSTPFRPCVPGEGSGCQQLLIGGSGRSEENTSELK